MSPLLRGMVLPLWYCTKSSCKFSQTINIKKKKTLWDKMLYNFYSVSATKNPFSNTNTSKRQAQTHTPGQVYTVTPDFTQHELSRRTRTVSQMEFCRPWVFFFCCPVSSLDGFSFSNQMKRVNISGLILEWEESCKDWWRYVIVNISKKWMLQPGITIHLN